MPSAPATFRYMGEVVVLILYYRQEIAHVLVTWLLISERGNMIHVHFMCVYLAQGNELQM